MIKLMWQLWRLARKEPKAKSVMISLLRFWDIYYDILLRSIQKLDEDNQKKVFDKLGGF